MLHSSTQIGRCTDRLHADGFHEILLVLNDQYIIFLLKHTLGSG
jgi:hypothetical protein